MAYPYPELLPLLRIQLSVSQYRAYEALKRSNPEEFKSALPVYTYAICPICQTVCSEAIDTYSLPLSEMKFSLENGIVLPRNYPMAYNPPCSHYLGTQTFLNLHDTVPPLESVAMYSGEVPFLSPHFLVSHIESYAVLHALPICQIVGNQFIPAFTRFIVTYFSIHPRLLIDECYASQFEDLAEEDKADYYPYNLLPAPRKASVKPVFNEIKENFSSQQWDNYYKRLYDLNDWSTEGKLGWLNPSTLGLEFGPQNRLANIYSNIKGHPYYLILFKGKLRTDSIGT